MIQSASAGSGQGEVFGLEAEDISREHAVIHIRDNRWRHLKRSRHRRHIPLWPQLNEMLTAYQEHFDRTTGLLFPAPRGGMFTDIRAGIRTAITNAKIEKHVTPHTFRPSYAAARMQTTDHHRAPVSPYTGHARTRTLVHARACAHLGSHVIAPSVPKS